MSHQMVSKWSCWVSVVVLSVAVFRLISLNQDLLNRCAVHQQRIDELVEKSTRYGDAFDELAIRELLEQEDRAPRNGGMVIYDREEEVRKVLDRRPKFRNWLGN
jgi:hypothetical protein